MRSNGIPVAPLTGNSGYWIKRGDEAAQSKDDVVFAADETERDNKIAVFAARGITQIVVTAHVMGDLVKFYGVRGTDFFQDILSRRRRRVEIRRRACQRQACPL